MKRNTRVNSEFFQRWSSKMAYVLGVVCTDGCLVEHTNGYHCLNITSKDLLWLQEIKRALQAEQTIGPKRRAYHLQIRNQVIYRSLLGLGLTPRKSKTLQLPSVPTEFLSDFVRGCFDGDGSVMAWRETRWRHTWQLRATLTSASRTFLEDIRTRLCNEAGLTRGGLWLGARAYVLGYAIGDALRLYRFMYTCNEDVLCLLRKRQIFEAFASARDTTNCTHDVQVAEVSS